VSHAGGALLAETVRASGLDRALTAGLACWRKPSAVHDPAKVLTDLAIALALGGDCLADIAVLRAEPDLFGAVASDPTVSRTLDSLAADAGRALAAIDAARAAARARVWALAGEHAPDATASAAAPLVVDLDATLVTAHSDKEAAAPTFKRGYGFHPLWSFADHGPAGGGEPLGVLLRPGNAGSNTAADHITVVKAALRQLPGHRVGVRPGRAVLVRADAAGATHGFLSWLTGRRLSYSVGFTLPTDAAPLLAKIPERVWAPAYDGDGQVRDGAWVAEVTGLLDLTSWPKGMRVIVRKERPHPGAQLRLTDADGHRITAFATNTRRGQLADLELRHRRRARCEDRIRAAKDTGCRTCRCTTSPATRSGARPWRWPASSPPGRRCWACPGIRLDAGNPNGSGCGVLHRRAAGHHRPPHRAAPAAPRPLGTARHHRDHHPAAVPRPRLTPRTPAPAIRTKHPGLEAGATGDDTGNPSHPQATITPTTGPRRPGQPSTANV
jgi:hypothetical protein